MVVSVICTCCELLLNLSLSLSYFFNNLSFFTVEAKPGRVVGPVLPYENVRQANDSYDGGVRVQNAVLPPQLNSPHCFFSTTLGKSQENCRTEASQVKQQFQQQYMPVKAINGSNIDIDCKGQPQQYAPAKVNPTMSADRNNNPYYQSQSRAGIVNSQISIDTKLLQAQSQFVVAGAAAAAVAAQREVGAMQLGLT